MGGSDRDGACDRGSDGHAADPRARECPLYVAASSEVFGDAGESPQRESSPMRPTSPYGVAKLAALGLVRVMRE